MINRKNYRKIYEPINSSLYSVQNKDFKWGVIDEDENIIIPFGKYQWIDGFQNGLAKVASHEDNECGTWIPVLCEVVAKQGIINELGEEVLPLEYDIWKFYGKDFDTIKVIKNDKTFYYPYLYFYKHHNCRI